MSILNKPTLRIAAMLAAALSLPALAQIKPGAIRDHDIAPRASTRVAAAPAPALSLTSRLIVKYKATPGGTARSLALHAQSIQAMAAPYGVQVQYLRKLTTGGELYKMNRKLALPQAFKLARQLMRQDSSIAYAEPDVLNVALALPASARPRSLSDDPLLYLQWDLHEKAGGINAPNAWDHTRGAGAVVAVLDTGYRPHPDLVANVLPGYDFIADASVANDGDGRDPDATDPGDDCGSGSSWHGTHVSGTIAAVGGNGIGVSGVAPEAKILPVRVLGACGGYTSDIVDGLAWATGAAVDGVPANPTPARVVNMSLGSEVPCLNTYREAVASATGRGAVLVVAAGNAAQNVRNAQPAGCPGAVAVAATNRDGGRAYYSNYGSLVTVAAPGGEMGATDDPNGILSTFNDGFSTPGNDVYGYDQGTSMAAPHVAGVVALMLSANPNLTVAQVRQILTSTARSFPAACAGCGAGIVDAEAAVVAAQAMH
jgi:serine protease